MKTHTLETAEADIVYDVQGPLPTADGSPRRTTLLQSMDALTNAAAALKARNGSQADDASDQRRSDSSPTL